MPDDDAYLLKDFVGGVPRVSRPEPTRAELERQDRLSEVDEYYRARLAELDEIRMLDQDKVEQQYGDNMALDSVRRGARQQLGDILHQPDDRLDDGTPVRYRSQPNPSTPGAYGTTFVSPGHLQGEEFSSGESGVALRPQRYPGARPMPSEAATRYHEGRHVSEGLGQPPQASSAPYPEQVRNAGQRMTTDDVAQLTEHYDGILAERYRNLSASEQSVYRAVKAGKGAAGVDLQRGTAADPHEYHNKVMDRDIVTRRVTPAEAEELARTPEGFAELRRKSRPR